MSAKLPMAVFLHYIFSFWTFPGHCSADSTPKWGFGSLCRSHRRHGRGIFEERWPGLT